MGIPTCVYITSGAKRKLKIGITRNLSEAMKSATCSEGADLVFAEWLDGALEAVDLYDKLTSMRRRRLLSFVSSRNPGWWDLTKLGNLVVAGTTIGHVGSAGESPPFGVWDDGEDPGGVGARLQIEPDDPVRTRIGMNAKRWPKIDQLDRWASS